MERNSYTCSHCYKAFKNKSNSNLQNSDSWKDGFIEIIGNLKVSGYYNDCVRASVRGKWKKEGIK